MNLLSKLYNQKTENILRSIKKYEIYGTLCN